MSRPKILRREQCPKCLDTSKDNLVVYSDGHSYCYSCKYFLGVPKSPKDTLGVYKGSLATTTNLWIPKEPLGYLKDTLDTLETYQYLAHRGISRETMEYYGVFTKVSPEGIPLEVALPYGSYTTIRKYDQHNFRTIGDSSNPCLFGMDKFNQGSSKSITITEGAYDAMSVYEALGRKYPSVAVRSASTARSETERHYHYLNSFENIYICFDNDKPGMEAAREVASLFDVNKIFHVKLDKWKDANEALQDSAQALRSTWYNAKRYEPKGVVSSLVGLREILAKESAQAEASYPFPTLQDMSYGIRLGELVLFTAQEKVGKTEVLRAIEHWLLKTTKDNLGIIHLEEQEKRSVQGLIGYSLGLPVHLPDSGLSLADQELALQDLVKTDGRLHVYSHYGSDDPDAILNVVRYLAAVAKCKYIFLDHITMLVTGFEGDDERKRLDYISTRLAMMTRELNFTLFMVSHVNDEGQTRGSRNIAKVADIIIHLDRSIEASDERLRNTTRLTCRGNRYAGITGPAGQLVFDPKSFILREVEQEVSNEAKLF